MSWEDIKREMEQRMMGDRRGINQMAGEGDSKGEMCDLRLE